MVDLLRYLPPSPLKKAARAFTLWGCSNIFPYKYVRTSRNLANKPVQELASSDCCHRNPSSKKLQSRRCPGRGRHRHLPGGREVRSSPSQCRFHHACRPASSYPIGSDLALRQNIQVRLVTHCLPCRDQWTSCGWSCHRR